MIEYVDEVALVLAQTDAEDPKYQQCYAPAFVLQDHLAMCEDGGEAFKTFLLEQARMEVESLVARQGFNIVKLRITEWHERSFSSEELEEERE